MLNESWLTGLAKSAKNITKTSLAFLVVVVLVFLVHQIYHENVSPIFLYQRNRRGLMWSARIWVPLWPLLNHRWETKSGSATPSIMCFCHTLPPPQMELSLSQSNHVPESVRETNQGCESVSELMKKICLCCLRDVSSRSKSNYCISFSLDLLFTLVFHGCDILKSRTRTMDSSSDEEEGRTFIQVISEKYNPENFPYGHGVGVVILPSPPGSPSKGEGWWCLWRCRRKLSPTVSKNLYHQVAIYKVEEQRCSMHCRC